MPDINIHIPQVEAVLDKLKQENAVNVFLIHGEEEYLVNHSRKKLVQEFVSPGEEEFKLAKTSVERMSCSELLDILRSPSLFAADRCYDLVDVPYFSEKYKRTDLELLKKYLVKRIDPGTRIIFSAADKISKRSTLYKTVRKIGMILEFPQFDIYKAGQVNRDGMYPYVNSYLGAANKRIAADAFKELRLRKENDLYSVIQELDKLIAYTGTRQVILLSDVELLVSESRSDQVFKLTDAILSRNMASALRFIEELIARGTPATHIIQLMARQYRSLIEVRQLVDRSDVAGSAGKISYPHFRDSVLPKWKKEFSEEAESGIFPIMKNHPYLIYKNVISCNQFSELQLQHGLIVLKEMDQRVKSTGGLPTHLLREMIFFWNHISV